MLKKEMAVVLSYALNKGFQIHPDALGFLESMDVKSLEKAIREIVREKTRAKAFQISQGDFEAYLGITNETEVQCKLETLSDPTPKITSAEGVSGYNALFASRFKKLKRVISDRPEAKMLKTITSAKTAKADEVYICGLVSSKNVDRNVTKITLEDPTGTFEGIIFEKDLQEKAGALLSDQFVMIKAITGKNSGYIIKEIILPDIPDHPPNRSESEVYAVFLSDLHIGSKYFMEKEFSEFVSWIAGPHPVARKVRFVLIGGDVVDGVGIYRDQDKELVCQTIEEQLERTRVLLEKIPDHVQIVIMPGNHDPGRRALPQPAIPKKYCPALWEMKNVTMVGNPAEVSLNGVRILMFHGQSIDDIVKTTPGLSYDSPVDVMRQLLRARHLGPIYGSQTPVAPESEDLLVVEEAPDIFHVGHVHKAELGTYRGVLLINSGSWQRQTPFQASVGMLPNPGIAILVNLKTFKALTENYNPDLDNVL